MDDLGQKVNISVVVVVYNAFCLDVPTCKALLDIDDPSLNVIIYDNSTRDYGNKSICETYRWHYLGGVGNMGLSKAYNVAVEFLSRQVQDDLLCLFDDDTYVDADYFKKLKDSYDRSTPKIYVPFIYSGGELLSPSMITISGNHSVFVNKEAVLGYTGKEMTAINSGMAIDMRVFEDYRYDEHIFLDGVDHQFIYDCKKRGIGLKVFDYECNHMFFLGTKTPYESSLNRFRIYIKDYRYIYQNYLFDFIRREGRKTLYLTKRYRRLQFIIVFIKALFQKPEKNQR